MSSKPFEIPQLDYTQKLKNSVARYEVIKLLEEMKEFISTPDFPRTVSKGFLVSWLTNVQMKMKP